MYFFNEISETDSRLVGTITNALTRVKGLTLSVLYIEVTEVKYTKVHAKICMVLGIHVRLY